MSAPPKEERYLRPSQVAKKTGFNERAIRRMLARGGVKGAKRTPGGHWLIPIAAVNAWISADASR